MRANNTTVAVFLALCGFGVAHPLPNTSSVVVSDAAVDTDVVVPEGFKLRREDAEVDSLVVTEGFKVKREDSETDDLIVTEGFKRRGEDEVDVADGFKSRRDDEEVHDLVVTEGFRRVVRAEETVDIANGF